MSGGSHIRAVGPEAAQAAQEQPATQVQDESLELSESWEEEVWEEDESYPRARWTWVLPTLAAMAIVGWTALYGWVFRDQLLAGGTPQQWMDRAVQWSIPVLLVVSVWLLAMRSSRREANRFADTAAMLRQEAGTLERRLTVVNRELSLAREFLTTQSRELESFGRIASEKLSTHAHTLQDLIHNNGEQVQAIASVSDTALNNMAKLRDDLPVIANSARDVSNQVGNAGRTAHDQLGKLIAGFERLNEFGSASERQVTALSERIGGSLATFETQLTKLEEVATARFEALRAQSDDFRVELDSREVDALAAMRQRAEQLRVGIGSLLAELTQEEEQSLAELDSRMGDLRNAQTEALAVMDQAKDRLQSDLSAVLTKVDELEQHAVEAAQMRIKELHQEAGRFDDRMAERDVRFNEEIAKRQDQFETREAQASELLSQRLAQLEAALAQSADAQIQRANELTRHSEDITAKVDQLNELFVSVSNYADGARQQLGEGLGSLSGQLASNRHDMQAASAALEDLTDSSVRLLEIIQSGARQSREDLPRAIEQASASLTNIEERAALLRGAMETTEQHGKSLSDYVLKTQDQVDQAQSAISTMHSSLAENTEDGLARLAKLHAEVEQLENRSDAVTRRTRDELETAMASLIANASTAFSSLESGVSKDIEKLASDIAGRMVSALEQAIREESGDVIARLDDAAAEASDKGREAAIQLRDQLSKVNELTGNLEQRVSRARELAQEQVDNDFARRTAMITESLNSNAIDIARALSEEVTDTAWAAYLKGDRGIFTRRAVKLIDNSEAREIMDLYGSDDFFRDHVNRYIHDFEAMLRTLLSTRDGNALGVTVLSSDMGKLYVALAQAIERLRN